ncbi:MAG: hypothetical protein B6I20_08490 [Bacteroidetes bacterium 4572_117]|nr:MAG: hypothetical protein B6I20_08490 [Bacteroidetes bacterium 4572_117]
MKFKKGSKIFSEELISNAIGWVAGLVTVDLLSHFFAVRSWKNGWGLFSRKTMIDADTFNILEWVITAVFGFIVLTSINKLIKGRLFRKKDNENEKNTDETEHE